MITGITKLTVAFRDCFANTSASGTMDRVKNNCFKRTTVRCLKTLISYETHGIRVRRYAGQWRVRIQMKSDRETNA